MAPKYSYVHVDVAARDSERVASLLWDLGAGGIEERDRPRGVTLVAYFARERDAKRVARALGRRWRARVAYVVGDDWLDAWKKYFKPVRLGDRLVIQPSWDRITPGRGDVVVTLDPGRAFGTGAHESTRLVLRELDRRIRGRERVLDVGCGSGILSVAALALGAGRALAVDNDETVLAVARENAALNGVGARLRVAATPAEKVTGRYDLVVANIEARVLIPLADALAARVAPRGVLILSGILYGQEAGVLEAYPTLRSEAVVRDGEWVALVLSPAPRTRGATPRGRRLAAGGARPGRARTGRARAR